MSIHLMNKKIIESSYPFGYVLDKSVVAKSVIFDIADEYGRNQYITIRSIEFSLKGVIYSLLESAGDFFAFATTEYDTSSYVCEHAFDTSLSKTGTWSGNSWISQSGVYVNQRLIVVFPSKLRFDQIIVNNGHSSGGNTASGANHVKINISEEFIDDTVYNNTVLGGELIFNGQFREHVAVDAADPEIVWGE